MQHSTSTNPTVQGIITIGVISAKLLISTELFGKMDPYVTIVYNTTLQQKKKDCKTQVNKKGDKQPQWNEKFEFELESMDDTFVLTVFDKDFIFDDLIGNAVMRAGTLISMFDELKSKGDEGHISLPIYNKVEKAGELNITINYE